MRNRRAVRYEKFQTGGRNGCEAHQEETGWGGGGGGIGRGERAEREKEM